LSEAFEIIWNLVTLAVSLYEITAFGRPNKRKLLPETNGEGQVKRTARPSLPRRPDVMVKAVRLTIHQ
jgi:hypothetical protein